MNGYARLSDVKGRVTGAPATTALDEHYVNQIEMVSREFDSEAGRHFYAQQATRYLTGSCANVDLWLPWDVASITTLSLDLDGDGTYERTLVENTDFYAMREGDDSDRPIVRLELNRNGTQIRVWPTHRRALRLTGLFGYCYTLEDSTLDTNEAVDDSETEIDVTGTATELVYVGDTAVIDSEQMEVTAVAPSKLTVVRAINGTAAASHLTSTNIYIRRFPAEVEDRVAERVAGLRWDAQGGYSAGITLMGDPQGAASSTQGRGSFARWRNSTGKFKRWAVA